MTSNSQLITHYNAIFQVKRLFYRPDAEKKVRAVVERLSTRMPDVAAEAAETDAKLKKLDKNKKKRAVGT